MLSYGMKVEKICHSSAYSWHSYSVLKNKFFLNSFSSSIISNAWSSRMIPISLMSIFRNSLIGIFMTVSVFGVPWLVTDSFLLLMVLVVTMSSSSLWGSDVMLTSSLLRPRLAGIPLPWSLNYWISEMSASRSLSKLFMFFYFKCYAIIKIINNFNY